jgi:hypothetical protein
MVCAYSGVVPHENPPNTPHFTKRRSAWLFAYTLHVVGVAIQGLQINDIGLLIVPIWWYRIEKKCDMDFSLAGGLEDGDAEQAAATPEALGWSW